MRKSCDRVEIRTAILFYDTRKSTRPRNFAKRRAASNSTAQQREKIRSLMHSLTRAIYQERMIDRSRELTSAAAAVLRRASAVLSIDRPSGGEIYACMPAVPPTNICHVIYEPGITLCPIYYILCYVDGLAILSDREPDAGHVAQVRARVSTPSLQQSDRATPADT